MVYYDFCKDDYGYYWVSRWLNDGKDGRQFLARFSKFEFDCFKASLDGKEKDGVRLFENYLDWDRCPLFWRNRPYSKDYVLRRFKSWDVD